MRANARGFTLVELMLVCAIVGILAATGGIVLVQILPSYNLQRAARDMVSNLRKARAMAVKLNNVVEVEFDADKGTYGLWAASDCGSANRSLIRQVPAVLKPDGTYESLTEFYGSGIRLGFPGRADPVTFSDDRICFNTMGLPSGQGYAFIRNSKDQGFRIGVRGLAGNIVMERCGVDGVSCTE